MAAEARAVLAAAATVAVDARAAVALKTVGANVAPSEAVEVESAEIQAEAETAGSLVEAEAMGTPAETDASGIPAEVLAAVEAEAAPAEERAS